MSTRMAIMKNAGNDKYWQRCEEAEILLHFWEKCKMLKSLCKKQVDTFPKR